MEEIVNSLSLKEQLLELMMLDIRYFGKTTANAYLPVTKLPKELKYFLKEYPIGGITLFRENLNNLHEIHQLTDDLQQNSRFGRFIGIDEEGGVVTRIKGATDMPGNMALGAINDTATTSKVANIIGHELSALGINLNFAPCLDVNSNPQNPIIGVRSFGQDPELVAKHGTSYIEGLHQRHIISCAKHFPGHGNVVTDTHIGDTYVHSSAVEIEKCDLKPFVAAINAQVDIIMTAHIIAPRLDNSKLFSNKLQIDVDTPTTLSHSIITKLLRGYLGYQGIIMSDALDMQAITNNFTPVEATILALTAGIDLILMPLHIWDSAGIERFRDYFNTLLNICENSVELRLRIKESSTRVLNLKQQKLSNFKAPKLDIIACQAHKEFEQQTAARAITLHKNTKKTLPWTTSTKDKILIISANNNIAQIAYDTLESLRYLNITIQLTNVETEATLTKQIEDSDKVLVLTYNLSRNDEKLDRVINRLNHFHKPYVMLSCRNPYDILYVNDVNTNVLVYGVTGLDQTNYQISSFTLNLQAAVTKIMQATSIDEFNTHCPVLLEAKKKDPRTTINEVSVV
jgi:beta-N-acetylhexosaminidase